MYVCVYTYIYNIDILTHVMYYTCVCVCMRIHVYTEYTLRICGSIQRQREREREREREGEREKEREREREREPTTKCNYYLFEVLIALGGYDALRTRSCAAVSSWSGLHLVALCLPETWFFLYWRHQEQPVSCQRTDESRLPCVGAITSSCDMTA